jgi:AcrR family transcriptional regulator
MSASGHFGRNDLEKSDAAHAAFDTTDRRALRTRQSLHQALIRLILERDYDEITVGDITDAANVGRSTFYAHFTDKDDLLRSGAGHLRAMLLHEHGNAVAEEHRPERRPLGFSRFMTAHLKEQHQLYRALMRGRAGPIMMDRFRQFLCEIVRTCCQCRGGQMPSSGQGIRRAVRGRGLYVDCRLVARARRQGAP